MQLAYKGVTIENCDLVEYKQVKSDYKSDPNCIAFDVSISVIGELQLGIFNKDNLQALQSILMTPSGNLKLTSGSEEMIASNGNARPQSCVLTPKNGSKVTCNYSVLVRKEVRCG